jgi:hypothetical protein
LNDSLLVYEWNFKRIVTADKVNKVVKINGQGVAVANVITQVKLRSFAKTSGAKILTIT